MVSIPRTHLAPSMTLTSLQLAEVRPINIRLEGESILGVTLLYPQGAHGLAECLRHKGFERSGPRFRYRQLPRWRAGDS